jgi:multidrug resistance efflux pump
MTTQANTGLDRTAKRRADGVRSPNRDTGKLATTEPSANDVLVQQQGLALALVAEALDHKQFQAAATAIVTELATAFACNRVSLGTMAGERLELAAISNSANFEGNSNVAVSLEDAMVEACHQETVVRYPASGSRFSLRAHAELSREADDTAILTIPLVGAKTIGALLFERTGDQPFDDAATDFAKQVALLVAPILHLKLRAERPLRQRLRSSITAMLSLALGPRHLFAKTTAIALIALLVLSLLVEGTARVTSNAALEPSETHAVVAPVRGYIESAQQRAGDVVTAGTKLASLDQREMRLERAKWESELGKLGKEYGAALAARDRTQLRVLTSRQNQVHAQISLLDNLMNRAHLVSPIDGVIVRGDLSEAFGSPVERGELLFEVEPLDKYRLILNVDERDVAKVKAGQSGRLVLAGKPDEQISFVVKGIMPVSLAKNGTNAFRVEAELDADPGWVRPGMVGAAKVDIGHRSLAWIYTHRLFDAIRLRWWNLGW